MYKFNVFTGALDIAGSTAAASWSNVVSTEALLPTVGNQDGDVRVTLDTDMVWVWDGTSTRWILTGLKAYPVGSSPNANGYTILPIGSGPNRTDKFLQLEPADATHPGVVTAIAQTFGGAKKFTDEIFADGSIDTSIPGTLSIGSLTATTINIGNASATINFNGTVNNNNVVNMEVQDQLITLNNGGGVGSASGSGIEIEEDSAITGYVKTSGDRNSFVLKAPNSNGVATITPGGVGITIDQSSHDPVSISTSNGLSIVGQSVSMALANGTVTGTLSASDWNTFNNKEPAVTSGTVSQYYRGDKTFQTLDTSVVPENGPLYFTDSRAKSAVVDDSITDGVVDKSPSQNAVYDALAGKQNLDSTLTALAGFDTNGFIVQTATDTFTARSLVGTANQINITNTNGSGNPTFSLPQDIHTAASPTFAKVISNGASDQLVLGQTNTITINTQGVISSYSLKLPTSVAPHNGAAVVSDTFGNLSYIRVVPTPEGDIPETSFTSNNDVVTDEVITGLNFSNVSIRAFKAIISVVVDATVDLYAVYELNGVQRGTDWSMSVAKTGDIQDILFNISPLGQVTYTSVTTSGFVSRNMKFRAQVLTI